MIRNPQPGLVLTSDELSLYDRSQQFTLPLSGISLALPTDWSDGPGDWTVVMHDGTTVHLPSTALPEGRALARELEDRGVAVQRE